MKRSFGRSFAMPFLITVALSPAAGADTTAPKKKPPAADPNGGSVSKDAQGHCWQHNDPHCPPNVACNPGPPIEVMCPPDKTPPTKK
jgi:hypothetical protein